MAKIYFRNKIYSGTNLKRKKFNACLLNYYHGSELAF